MQQQIKNILNSQIDTQLSRAKDRLRSEGIKKVTELQKELSTPKEIMKKLGVEINPDSCSNKGKEKFDKIYNSLNNKLTKLENIIKTAKEKLEGIDNTIKPIYEEGGPIAAIKSLSDSLKELISILQIIILARPILLGVLTGLIANHAAGDRIQHIADKASSKVAMYAALIASIPLMIDLYTKKAEKILKILQPLIAKLKEIEDKILKLKLFMYNFKLQFESQCDALDQASNLSVGNENNPIFPDPNGPTPLDEYLALLNDRYNDVYQALLESNNEKAIQRIYAIKKNFEEDYNISFKVINLS